MNKKKGPDVIDKVLEACYRHNPDALFVMSLMHQYEERGSLSKKQLEGLLGKAKRVPDLPDNWIATLEAIVLKMPTREKAPAVNRKTELPNTGVLVGQMDAILTRYPQHKRVVFLQQKFVQKKALDPVEAAEIEKFYRLLITGSK